MDVKGDNVMLTQNFDRPWDTLRLIDFAMAAKCSPGALPKYCRLSPGNSIAYLAHDIRDASICQLDSGGSVSSGHNIMGYVPDIIHRFSGQLILIWLS